MGAPTYAGKLPNKLMPTFQTNLVGNGAVAVAVVLFGNRSYDNSLAELIAILQAGGFRTVCATACVGQHAFAKALATGRPNQEDLGFVKDIARRVAERLRDGSPFVDLQVPGDAAAPHYVPKDEQGQPAKFLKAHPKTDPSKCVNCGTCARLCPMGSIDPEDVIQVEGICIKCQAYAEGNVEGTHTNCCTYTTKTDNESVYDELNISAQRICSRRASLS